MTGNLEFQFPWLLGLLALLPVYALLRGKVGKLSALSFSSADIARAAGATAKMAAIFCSGVSRFSGRLADVTATRNAQAEMKKDGWREELAG
jgi:hypothetical protein